MFLKWNLRKIIIYPKSYIEHSEEKVTFYWLLNVIRMNINYHAVYVYIVKPLGALDVKLGSLLLHEVVSVYSVKKFWFCMICFFPLLISCWILFLPLTVSSPDILFLPSYLLSHFTFSYQSKQSCEFSEICGICSFLFFFEMLIFLLYSKVTQLYTYVFYILFHCRLSQDIEHSSLCCVVGPCVFILCVTVCICQPQTPSLSLARSPSPLATASPLSMPVSLFLFCR